MCVSHHHCCGCPLIFGVFVIFIVNLLDLTAWILKFNGKFPDYLAVGQYSFLTLCFLSSFCNTRNKHRREFLFRVYVVSFIIWKFFFIWYEIFSGEVAE